MPSSPAQEVVGEITAAGGDAVACTESVATAAGGEAIVQTALDHHGRIDILIHNAGNVRRGSLKEMTYEDFDAVVDVHLRGAFHVVRPAYPVMCEAGYGRIVLTSSIGGLYGNHDVANYAVSKAGIVGLSNVVAIEGEAEGVKCNVIVPGAVTRMAAGLDTSAYAPMGSELVAPVVGWLAHESCIAGLRQRQDRCRPRLHRPEGELRGDAEIRRIQNLVRRRYSVEKDFGKANALREYLKFYIDGKWVDPVEPKTLEVTTRPPSRCPAGSHWGPRPTWTRRSMRRDGLSRRGRRAAGKSARIYCRRSLPNTRSVPVTSPRR